MDTFLAHLPIAHRGLHLTCPENTLPAFLAAQECGYAIETDIRFTADGELVLFHDDDLSRMAKDSRRIDACTLAQLKEVQIGGERIPTLDELLQAAEVPLLIEIKNMPGVKGERIALALSEKMRRYKGEYAVQSFNPLYVRAYKKLHPEIKCGVLGTADKTEFGKTLAERFRARIVRTCPPRISRADFVSYRFEDVPCRALKRYPLRLIWVVRSKEQEARARAHADNIIFENYLPTR